MAKAVYRLSVQEAFKGSFNFTGSTVKAVGVTSAYTFSQSHQFLSSVTGIVFTSPALSGKTCAVSGSNVVLNAANTVCPAVSGSTVVAIIVYIDTGSAATSPLLAYIDSGTGLPLTPNGEQVTLDWDDAGGIVTFTF